MSSEADLWKELIGTKQNPIAVWNALINEETLPLFPRMTVHVTTTTNNPRTRKKKIRW